MRSFNLLAIVLLLSACPPAPVPPVPPDADAAPPSPPPAKDAAPSGTCDQACSAMAVACGAPQPLTCAQTMTALDRDRLMRAPSGQPVTCACVAAAKSRADLTACGVACP